MTHNELLEIGFKLYGIEENDPYYKIVFKHPIKFNIYYLSGMLDNDSFWLYGNDIKYTDKEGLKKVIEIVGSEICK